MAVSAKSDEGKIIRELRKLPQNRASITRLAKLLGGNWTAETLRTKLVELDRGDSPVFLVRGGVQYVGVENCADPGLYRQVESGIMRRWARERSIARPEVLASFASSAKNGDWTRPDLVIHSRTTLNGQPADVYHALEVEQRDGFSVKSVYQAYEQSRGAHFAWVFFTGALPEAWPWQRIVVVAKELGVGLVHMPRPSRSSEWGTVASARRFHPSPADVNSFLASALGSYPASAEQEPIDLTRQPVGGGEGLPDDGSSDDVKAVGQ